MKFLLLSSLGEFMPQLKLVLAVVFTALATAADAVLPSTADGWGRVEDLTVKGLLAVLAFTFWRSWMAEMKVNQDLRDKHELKMETVVVENTRSNQAVVATMKSLVDEDSKLVRDVAKEHITKHGRHVG